MLNMSFYNGTLDKAALRVYLATYHKPIYYTHGLAFRGPTIRNVPTSLEDAYRIIETNGLLDAREREDGMYLNTYSENDMF